MSGELVAMDNVVVRFLGVIVAGGLLLMSRGVFAESTPSVRTLDGLVGEWVSLRGQIDEEQRAWDAQARQWEREIDLLTQEQEQLKSALSRLASVGETQDVAQADLRFRRDRLRESMNAVETLLARIEPRIYARARQVPEELLTGDLKIILHRGARETERRDRVSVRVQHLLGVLQTLETLQANVHIRRKLVAFDDEPRREMDVIFIGLTCAYAVSLDDSLAASGIHADGAWRWTRLPHEGLNIRRMIQIASKDIVPGLIAFPIGMAFVDENGMPRDE